MRAAVYYCILIAALGCLFFGLCLWQIWRADREEQRHPCLEYGPERMELMYVGKTLMPYPYRPCLKRAR